VLQQTLAGFSCPLLLVAAAASSASRRSSCSQAAAAARVAGETDILNSAKNGDFAFVLSHLIVDAHSVNKRDRKYAQAPSSLIYFLHMFLS
jgi:hypothetical protein